MDAPARDAYVTDVEQTTEQRRQVRNLVRAGQWQQAEPDRKRWQAYIARRRALVGRNEAESIIGTTEDFQRASFLSLGARRSRAVAFVEVSAGLTAELGTGFLISPSLFLTNMHVIRDAAAARGTVVTFDRELDETGAPRAPTAYLLDPDSFALFSPEDALDYALVALGRRQSGPATPEELGYCILSNSPDKHVLGMNCNIIEHPNGLPKLIAIRNNLLTARTDTTLLYETDTEQGASGAPVFNDDWELVALHHWGQPHNGTSEQATDARRNVNEGIRISAIYTDLATRVNDLPADQQALLQQALGYMHDVRPAPRTLTSAPVLSRKAEAVTIDQNYADRPGYDASFIPSVSLPLPTATGTLAAQVAALRADEPEAAAGELRYEHFSIKMNKGKRMAMFTATNIDGNRYLEVDRTTGQVANATEGETWFRDPRISASFFLDQTFYSAWSTYFDRGHLTRRTDPTWGTDAEAERANADTFHFTNCTPQHFRFNQSATYWQGLERYVLENGVLATDTRGRLCVFQGPVFDDRIDLWADDVQVPSSFFKIVVWRSNAGLKAVGLIADQLRLLSEARHSLGAPKPLPSVDVNHWRVPIASIEKKTLLDFGAAIRNADTIALAGQPDVGEAAVLIRSFAAIRL